MYDIIHLLYINIYLNLWKSYGLLVMNFDSTFSLPPVFYGGFQYIITVKIEYIIVHWYTDIISE